MRTHLREYLLAGVSCVALAAPAMAAPPTPLYNWTGFYAGGNVGYSWGQGAVNYNEPALGASDFATSSFSGSNKLDGVLGGFQFGYNWQLNNAWVWGLETDFQFTNEKAARNFTDCEGGACTLTGSLNSKFDWIGTVRGRVGWLANPTTLVYATGGFAYGRVNASGSFTDSGDCDICAWSFNQTAINTGWTVGGGIEAAFPKMADWNTTNWTWKIEYLYIDLGTLSGAGFDPDFGGPYSWSARFTDNILRFGVNYRLP